MDPGGIERNYRAADSLSSVTRRKKPRGRGVESLWPAGGSLAPDGIVVLDPQAFDGSLDQQHAAEPRVGSRDDENPLYCKRNGNPGMLVQSVDRFFHDLNIHVYDAAPV